MFLHSLTFYWFTDREEEEEEEEERERERECVSMSASFQIGPTTFCILQHVEFVFHDTDTDII